MQTNLREVTIFALEEESGTELRGKVVAYVPSESDAILAAQDLPNIKRYRRKTVFMDDFGNFFAPLNIELNLDYVGPAIPIEEDGSRGFQEVNNLK